MKPRRTKEGGEEIIVADRKGLQIATIHSEISESPIKTASPYKNHSTFFTEGSCCKQGPS